MRPGPNVGQAMKGVTVHPPYASATIAKTHHQMIFKFLSRLIMLRKKNKNENLTAYKAVHVNTVAVS